MKDLETSADPSVLAMLRCPISKSRMSAMNVDQLKALNELVASGEAKDHAGRLVEAEPMDFALVNEELNFAYRVRHGIIKLIADDAIVLPSQ